MRFPFQYHRAKGSRAHYSKLGENAHEEAMALFAANVLPPPDPRSRAVAIQALDDRLGTGRLGTGRLGTECRVDRPAEAGHHDDGCAHSLSFDAQLQREGAHVTLIFRCPFIKANGSAHSSLPFSIRGSTFSDVQTVVLGTDRSHLGEDAHANPESLLFSYGGGGVLGSPHKQHRTRGAQWVRVPRLRLTRASRSLS